MRWPPYWVWSGGKLFTKSFLWASWLKQKQKAKYSEKCPLGCFRCPLLQGQSARPIKRRNISRSNKKTAGRNFNGTSVFPLIMMAVVLVIVIVIISRNGYSRMIRFSLVHVVDFISSEGANQGLGFRRTGQTGQVGSR